MTSYSLSPNTTGGVLVASPDHHFREQVLQSLPQSSNRVQQAQGGAEALVKLETGDWQVLYLDRRLPDLDTEELIQIIKLRFPGIQVVLIDSDREAPSPKQPARAQAAEPAQISSTTTFAEPLPGMVGTSASMHKVYRLARLVAPRNATVLISGPTGTGKELVARALHMLSPRAQRPFVVLNCAAIPESLLESELFGHVRGAFTGAAQTHAGRVCAAQGGTLFLDEIGELPLGLQAKLLRFLDQKEVQRLGSTEVLRVDVRVVAATNADLHRKVREGAFRSDLLYRVSVFPLNLPALSQRKEDVVPLAEHFLARAAADAGIAVPSLSPELRQALMIHTWPGNVRELRHAIERALILAGGESTIRAEHFGTCAELAEEEFAPLPSISHFSPARP